MFRLLLVAFVLGPIPLDSLADEPDARSSSSIRGSGEDLQVRLHGRMIDASGDPVLDAKVSVHMRGLLRESTIDATCVQDRFEVRLPVNRIQPHTVSVSAVAANRNKLAMHHFPIADLRLNAATEMILTLQPTERLTRVVVMDDGQSVPGAHVNMTLASRSVLAMTDDSGIASLPTLQHEQVRGLACWTDDHRIGGFWVRPDLQRDPTADEFECELHSCREQTVRLVDLAGDPVKEIPITVNIATTQPQIDYIGAMPHHTASTSENGDATFSWFPDWDDIECYLDLHDRDWSKSGKLKWNDGVAIQTVKPIAKRSRVCGRLVHAGGNAAGFCIQSQSFQHPEQGRMDRQVTFTDLEGRFWLDALPESTYVSCLDDRELVSQIVDWIPAPHGEPAEPLELNTRTGTRANVIVTGGKGNQPLEGVRINLNSQHQFPFVENGTDKIGTAGRTVQVTTDEHGQGTAFVADGPLHVIAHHGSWVTETNATVIAGETAVITIHRPSAGKRAIQGRLIASEEVDLEKAKIRIAAIDGESIESIEVTSDAEGRFDFSSDASLIGIYAESGDGNFAGIVRSANQENRIDVGMLPRTQFRGRLLNSDDDPIADHTVRARIKIHGVSDVDMLRDTQFNLGTVKAKTDAQGFYSLEDLPVHAVIDIFTFVPGSTGKILILESALLNHEENRPVAVSRIRQGNRERSETDERLLDQQFESLLRDCRLGDYRLLVIRTGDATAANEWVNGFLLRHRKLENIARFMTLVVQPNAPQLALNKTYMLNKDWPEVTDRQVFVAAYSAQGEELGRMTLDADHVDAIAFATSFVNDHAPSPADANQKWEQAIAAAKLSNQRVWAINGGRYCGPCFKLSRWIDDHQDLLSRDYVFVKIDATLDDHGDRLADVVSDGRQLGVPFHAIFDSTGERLIDSDSRLGNIGHPTGYDGRQHLRKMLEATHQKLTEAEIDFLVDSLRE